MLLSTKAAEVVSGTLEPDHFYRASHGTLYRVMQSMMSVGLPLDAITVNAYLEEQGVLEEVGGSVRVYELAALVLATANVLFYANLVRDAWIKRLVEKSALIILQGLETNTAEESVVALEQAALTISTRADSKHDVFVDLKRALMEIEQRFDAPLTEGWGVPVPFTFLKPMQGGRLYVLGGYQKDGKTILATQFASVAAEAGKKVGILSLEMSYSDLTNRWLQQRTGIHQDLFRTGRVAYDMLDSARSSMREMTDWDVKLVDDEAITPQAVRKYQRMGKFDLLIIDHLHRMRWKDRHDLEDSIKSITNVAREFDVPILLLCQLSRGGDNTKPFPIPTSRQIRETAMLEMDASAIWLIYRERDQQHIKTNDAKFITSLNRYGPEGIQDLYFDQVSTSFVEAPDWRNPPTTEPVKEEVFPF